MFAGIQIVDSFAAVCNIGSESGGLRAPQKLQELQDLGHWQAGPGHGRGPQVQDVQDGAAVGRGGGPEQPGDIARV